MLNYFETVQSEYANSPTLDQLISSVNDYLDPQANFDAFFNLMWNVQTASGYGLQCWGRIVGVGNVLNVNAGAPYFGFEQSSDAQPFDQAPFYDALTSGSLTTNFTLTDQSYRTLIFAKALANITDGCIPSINQILINLFIIPVAGRTGNIYVTDGENMSLTYTSAVRPQLTAVEQAIISQSGVLPRPPGVAASLVMI